MIAGVETGLALENTSVRCLERGASGADIFFLALPFRYRYTRPAARVAAAIPIPSLLSIVMFFPNSRKGRTRPQTSSISKLTSTLNCSIRLDMSAREISLRRVAPNFSTQKLAMAEPTMIPRFIFSKETSPVLAR